MFHPTEFRDLVSGRRRGARAAIWRAGLRLAEIPYAAAVRFRNWRYDANPRLVTRAAVPVVSVGNLTLGGTGKSPAVRWIARWFRDRGVRVAVLSRGYGAEAGQCNDEALELEQRLPDVPHLENPDRVAAARAAVEALEMHLLVLDDAFQHRRIARDLDVVLLDALEPFGFGHVFPRGTLREPAAGLRRADVVILSRADMLDPARLESLRGEVEKLAPRAVWVEASHAPEELLNASGKRQPLGSLRDRPVAAFCGLGNPAGFQHTLAQCGYPVVAFREFPDHHRYTGDDVKSLAEWAERSGAQAALCTHKDLVKLGTDRLGSKELWAVAIGMRLLAGQNEFEARLAALAPTAPTGNCQPRSSP